MINTDNYIMFDDYNTLTDFKMYIDSLEISEAEMKEEKVDVPGADGLLDFSRCLTRRY